MQPTPTYKNRAFSHIVRCFVFALTMLTTVPVLAQFYNGMNTEFGKNRVQWKNPKWNYYRNNVFDVYFYGTDEMALYVQNYAEQQIPKMESVFSSRFTRKVQFIIYNTQNDLKHSNINYEEENDGNTGGVARLVGSKVILCYNGSYADLECQIRKGIAMLLINQITNGVSVGAQIRSTFKYDIPVWYREGLCSYIADDWDSYHEAVLSEGIVSGRYKRINQLAGDDARIAGYSFWRFIEETYGKQTFNDILRLSENARSVKRGLHYATGKKFADLTDLWYKTTLQRYAGLNTNLPTTLVPTPLKRRQHIFSVAIAPDGQKKAFVASRDGVISVFVQDVKSGTKKRVFRTGFRSDQATDMTQTLVAWHPNGEMITIINETKGGLELVNIDLETGKEAATSLVEFNKVTSFSYSPVDSRLITLSATRDGKPDIYVMNLFSRKVQQITSDYFTDIDPVFSHDGRNIIFSSNRNTASLEFNDSYVAQTEPFRLFTYNYSDSDTLLTMVGDAAVSNSVKPQSRSDGTFVYLNDSCGYYNLFEAAIDSAISYVDTAVHYRYFAVAKPLTNYTDNIYDYSVNPVTGQIEILVNRKGQNRLYQAQPDNTASLPMSPYAMQRLAKANGSEDVAEEVQPKTEHRFKASYRPVQKPADSVGGSMPAIASTQNTNPAENTSSDKPKRQQMYNYYIQLFSNKLLGQVDFSYLNFSYQPFSGGGTPIYLNSGFNVSLGASLTDLFENYRIDGGVKLNTSFVNNEYVLKLSDLHRRLDKSLTFHRNVVDASNGYYYRRTFTNEVLFMLTYPFSEILALRGTAIYRNDHNVFLSIDDHSLAEPDRYDNWVGLRAEFVLDDTRRLATNIHVGTRGKVFAEYYQLASRNTTNIAVVGFDVRDYRRLWRSLIWANRIAGSASFGQSQLIYYMGGVDNWIAARFNSTTPVDQGMSYAYQTLATNMRGFQQNIRNGNSFIVINSELRFPVFACLIDRPINYEFIKNFQIVAFGDVGTAWTGLNPYDLNNALYTTHYTDGSLDISVTEQKDPIVGGVGVGLRTTILGYFVRFDVAWGIEDRQINKKPQLYFSLNLDF